MNASKTRCLEVVSGHEVDPGAAGVCQSLLMDDSKTQCLQAALDKRYSTEELATCRAILMDANQVRCMAAAGRRPRPNRVEAQGNRDDREDEDDRSRRRWRRSDDERGRRRNRDDGYVLRLLNRHHTTVTRFYWRYLRGGQFREVRLDAPVRSNEYHDVSLPDDVVQVCVESWDGHTLWFPEVRVATQPDATLFIPADTPHWRRARCRDSDDR